ncbi:transmembrane protein 70 homolog, mitochondrial [Temnothorax americanus]|uniref:transmembrane protein 70 homolog, mitochondrial n=1 Tax=Temnothorax americanus TaxID=1964332 RepID=UPI0040691358
MTLMLRAYAFHQKRLFFKNFDNLKCCLTCITHNGYNFERCSAGRNVKFIHNVNSFSQDYKAVEIYYGPLTRQIKALKLFSLLTSCSSLMVQPFLYSKAVENDNIGVVLGIFACIGFFAITTPLLIHVITKKYVTHLYYDAKKDVYIANTYNLFARTKEIAFTPKDVIVPEVTGMFTNCVIKNIPLFLEQKFFHDSSHYIRIMGYDKPVDFKLNNGLNRTVTVDVNYKEDENKK